MFKKTLRFDDDGYPKRKEIKCTTMPCSRKMSLSRGNELGSALSELLNDKFKDCNSSDLFVVNCMYDNGVTSRSVINHKTLMSSPEYVATHKVILMAIDRLTGIDADNEVMYMYNRFINKFVESHHISTIKDVLIPVFSNKCKDINTYQYAKTVDVHRIDPEDRQPVILAGHPEKRSNAPTKYAVFYVGDNTDFDPPVGLSMDFVTLDENGFTNEALLAIVIDRLEGFQSGEFPCDENATALEACKMALEALMNRTRDRRARNVENKHEI